MKNLNVIVKRFDMPDEVSHFEKGVFETIKINGTVIGRATYEPGWKWSKHVSPLSGTKFCEVEHLGMVLSGSATAAFENGDVHIMNEGDLFYISSDPHDSWVVGDDDYVSLHFIGAEKYAD